MPFAIWARVSVYGPWRTHADVQAVFAVQQLAWCLASTLKKKSKGIVMNHALLSSSVEFSCV